MDQPQIVTPWWQDKALYAMALGLLIPTINAHFGINLSTDKLSMVLMPVTAYIVAHKLKTFGLAAAWLKAQALVEVKALEQKALAAVSDP